MNYSLINETSDDSNCLENKGKLNILENDSFIISKDYMKRH